MNRIFKKVLASIMVAVMVICAIPLAGIDFNEVFVTKTEALETSGEYKEYYKDFILQKEYLLYSQYLSYINSTGFAAYDMDNNGIPELIVRYWSGGGYYYDVFSVENSKVVKKGGFDFRRCLLYQFKNKEYPGIVVLTFFSSYNGGNPLYTTDCRYYSLSSNLESEFVLTQNIENGTKFTSEKKTSNTKLFNLCNIDPIYKTEIAENENLKEIEFFSIEAIEKLGWNNFFNTSYSKMYCNWEDAYYDFLINKAYSPDYDLTSGKFKDELSQKYFHIVYFSFDNSWNVPEFTLHDMDNDGVPELLAYNNASMAGSMCYCYTFKNNKIEYIGDVGFRTGSYWCSKNSDFPGLFYLSGNMGVYYGYYYYINDGKIQSQKVVTITEKMINNQYELVVECSTNNTDLYNAYYDKKYDCPFSDWINISQNYKWEDFLLKTLNSSIYSSSLALYSCDLCDAANNTNDVGIKAMYAKYGYKNVEANNYSNFGIAGHDLASANAYTMGYRKINNSVILTVTLRGTTSLREIIGDGTKGFAYWQKKDLITGIASYVPSSYLIYDNIFDYEEAVWNGLKSYISKQSEIKNADNLIIYITGHSLGGAAANALAAKIDYYLNLETGEWTDKVKKENVFAYTLGAIKVLPEEAEDITPNITTGFENIHNIFNFYDTYSPYGKNATQEISSVFAKFGCTELFSKHYDEGTGLFDIENHMIVNYKDAINNNLVVPECSTKDGDAGYFAQKYWDAGVSGNVILNFKQSWFENNSSEYNAELCEFTSKFAMLGYDQGDSNGNQNELRSGLEKCGFTDVESNNRTGENEVNYFITHRDIKIGKEKYTLIFAGFIGTYKAQWQSDFDPYTGDIHYGFENARNYAYRKLGDYIFAHNLNLNKVKFLFTGHSRGAATANLLSAKLIDDKIIKKNNGLASLSFNPENVFTYTFATPNTAKRKDYAQNKVQNDLYAERYLRIFNVVNPEDFVTKCMPYDWGYGRYGRTLTLPSRTNTTEWEKYLIPMKYIFGQYRDVYNNPYNPYNEGEEPVYKLIHEMTESMSTVEDYYDEKYPGKFGLKDCYSFKTIISATLCKFLETDDYSYIADAVSASALYGGIVQHFIQFFVSYGGMSDRFAESHMAQTYCAYVTLMSSELGNREFYSYKNIVNCPVDVEIYDKSTNEIVGRIKNNVVDETIAAKDNSIVMTVDGDSKQFWLPSDGEYDVRLVGNDTGTMDYTVATVNSDKGETDRVNFFDVAVTDKLTLTSQMSGEDFELDNYSLKYSNGKTLKPTEYTKDISDVSITVKTDGNGLATESMSVKSGDYVTLNATPDEGNEFVGWYADGKLVSTDMTYSFVVKEDVTFTAKFKETETEIKLGDVNGDTLINSSDALLVLQHTVQQITLTPEQILCADVTKDNLINSTDALEILQYTVGQIDKF